MHITARIPSLLLAVSLATTAQAQWFGAVYTQSNDPAGNAVQVALRLPSGSLVPFASFHTGGDGTGAGLGSQGALADANGNRLLVVNAGSNELTLFRTFADVFLWRTDTVASGGTLPTSVASRGNLVYVLNAGSDTVDGFRIVGNQLHAIPGASYPLSQAGAAGAQVAFSPNGRFLLATERATDKIAVWPVQNNGRLGAAQFQNSAGTTPFGFAFRGDDVLFVSEAAGGSAGASTASSYRLQNDGTLVTLTSAAPTTQSAACWAAIPRGGHFGYTANTGSGTITGYALGGNGSLTLLDPSGVSGSLAAGGRAIDLDFDPRGRFLFVLDSGNDTVNAFRRNHDGSLTALGSGLPVADGTAGLLVR